MPQILCITGATSGIGRSTAERFAAEGWRNLRCDLHGTGVRVTNVEPGMSETEFSLVRYKGNAAVAGAIYKSACPLQAEDIADAIWWAGTRPAHVNVCRIEVMPVSQSNGGTRVYKGQ